jgi:hypothetical protein
VKIARFAHCFWLQCQPVRLATVSTSRNTKCLFGFTEMIHGDQGWQPSLRLEYGKLKSAVNDTTLSDPPVDNPLYLDTRITVVVRFERDLGDVFDSTKPLLLPVS